MHRDRESIAAAVGRIPSGCAILTVSHGGRETGVLVSWVQQASFEPLCLSVCLKQGRPAADFVDNAGRFLLNVVSDDPAAMFRHFGKGFAPDEDAFSGLESTPTDYGRLLPGCIAHLGCEVRHKAAAGDHDLYIADATAASTTPAARPSVHLRKSALSY